ncbi:MAG TPA: TIGR04282 family arsenosugar biosynthesis glycosyltransferase [Candidatus Dormibacteraeota bacterium]|nr:TIGR04282 family arsenosugar biosynthesis glycosyltransferase [Candidatus Dormibacteraeota bacterium]
MRSSRATGTAEAALVLYARVPRPGQVKTRMIPWLGARGALGLHLALLEDSLGLLRAAARDAGAAPFVAFSEDWEPPREAELARIAGAAAGLARLPQSGGDLGERLTGTFERLAARGYRRVVVIGSDSPTLPAAILRAAFATLCLGADVVLGPAEDGGYYLVGSSRPVAGIFRGIPWGTPGVLDATLAAAGRAAARVVLLSPWYDVDLPEDLDRLRSDLSGSGPAPACALRTWDFAQGLVRDGRLPRRPSRG